MVDILRFLRIGIINLVGISIPGGLAITLYVGSVLVPVAVLIIEFPLLPYEFESTQMFQQIGEAVSANKVLITALVLVLAYVIGYIIRLSSPDELDKVSGKRVIEKMAREQSKSAGHSGVTPFEAAKNDKWPYRGEAGDQFPYDYFKEYLEDRGLTECAKYVRWSHKPDEKRTKQHVNLVKLGLYYNAPALGAIIESNEAHVRLMFGVWKVLNTTKWAVLVGMAMAIWLFVRNATPIDSTPSMREINVVLMLHMGLVLICLPGAWWAKRRIENLFHYQRVRELTYIFLAEHVSKEGESFKRSEMREMSRLGSKGNEDPYRRLMRRRPPRGLRRER